MKEELEREDDCAAAAVVSIVKELADKCDTIEEMRASVADICKDMGKAEDDDDECDGMTDEQFDVMLELIAKLVEKADSVAEAAKIVRDAKINK